MARTSGSERKALAETFFRGVFGGDPSVVDELSAEDVVVTYPVFADLFDTAVIRGRREVREFAKGFAQRWVDAEITIHESLAEADIVVLVWSFRARNVGSARTDGAPTGQVHSWGGITLYRFDDTGRIVAEIGEESSPGPFRRAGLS